MPPIPNLIFIAAISIMGIGFFITIVFVAKSKTGLWGNPSIHPFLFYSGKFSMYICWGLGLLKAIIPGFGWLAVPYWMSWFGAILVCFSVTVILLAFYHLGTSLKYGLPHKETSLITTGLYRFSRHPLYLGVFFVSISSAIFFPHIVNIMVAGYCIFTQYLMIIEEEKFLALRFGKEWDSYKRRVRRFL